MVRKIPAELGASPNSGGQGFLVTDCLLASPSIILKRNYGERVCSVAHSLGVSSNIWSERRSRRTTLARHEETMSVNILKSGASLDDESQEIHSNSGPVARFTVASERTRSILAMGLIAVDRVPTRLRKSPV